jgi:hypothetical protein
VPVIIRDLYGPWETRTITVDSLTLGRSNSQYEGYAAHFGAMQRTSSTGHSFGGLGWTGWTDPAIRIATADQARNGTRAVSGNNVSEGSGDVPLDFTVNADTDTRREWQRATAGITTLVRVDNTFGTTLHTFDVVQYQGALSLAILPKWLSGLHAQPHPESPFGQAKPLTVPEWDALWGAAPGPDYIKRQVDVYACSASVQVHAAFDAHPSGSVPTLTRKRRGAETTTEVDWFDADVVYAAPTAGTFSDGSSWTVGGDFGTGADTPTLGALGPPINPGDLVFDDQLDTVFAPYPLEGTTPGFAGPIEWIIYESQWPSGVDPGYDASGIGDPNDPTGPFPRVGGDAASHWGQVRITMSVTYTVRFRWYGQVYRNTTAPPLHQRGRLGVLDAPTQVVSGRMSPQSSSIQGGFL